MREYTAASLAMLVFALGLSGARGLWQDRALWLGFIAFALMTLLADVVLTGFGVYSYDGRFSAGLYIGRMPIEDLAYGLAFYLVAVTVWCWERRTHG